MQKLLILLVFVGVFEVAIGQALTSEKAIKQFFQEIGTYTFTNEDGRNQLKTYYLSRNVQLSWANAYSFCRANHMNLVELPTKKEADKFLTLCANYAPAFWYHVGGSAEGMSDRLDYYWMTTGEQITYSIEYLHEQPDNSNGKEKCLSIAMSPNKFQFNDVDCWEHFIWHFACQQVKDI